MIIDCLFFIIVIQEQEDHDASAEEANHDPHFEPIVSLPEQEVKTLEEDEEELFKMQVNLSALFAPAGQHRALLLSL